MMMIMITGQKKRGGGGREEEKEEEEEERKKGPMRHILLCPGPGPTGLAGHSAAIQFQFHFQLKMAW